MPKKYIFVDLDGTLIDHSTRSIPLSAKNAIKKAQDNGHVVVICTGRPPCLLYGIDKEVGVESYIAANGRYAVHKDEIILNKAIPKEIVAKIATFAKNNKLDIAVEG